MRNYMSSIRRFKNSRINRLKFKSNQKKVWSIRLGNMKLKKSAISRKNLSQLAIFDKKAILALNLSLITNLNEQ